MLNLAENTMTEPSQDFDWESVEPDISEHIDDAAREMASTALASLVAWIAGEAHNADGIRIRTYVAMWFLLPEWARKSQTDIAEIIGVSKASLGRQVSSFRDTFPGMKNAHMKSESARAVYRRILIQRHDQR